MQRDVLIKNLKIIVVAALIIGLIGAVLFLFYGFTIIWQAMAATIISIFLSIVTILFILTSVYLWIKNLLLKREIDRYKEEIQRFRTKLKEYDAELKKYKTGQ